MMAHAGDGRVPSSSAMDVLRRYEERKREILSRRHPEGSDGGADPEPPMGSAMSTTPAANGSANWVVETTLNSEPDASPPDGAEPIGRPGGSNGTEASNYRGAAGDAVYLGSGGTGAFHMGDLGGSLSGVGDLELENQLLRRRLEEAEARAHRAESTTAMVVSGILSAREQMVGMMEWAQQCRQRVGLLGVQGKTEHLVPQPSESSLDQLRREVRTGHSEAVHTRTDSDTLPPSNASPEEMAVLLELSVKELQDSLDMLWGSVSGMLQSDAEDLELMTAEMKICLAQAEDTVLSVTRQLEQCQQQKAELASKLQLAGLADSPHGDCGLLGQASGSTARDTDCLLGLGDGHVNGICSLSADSPGGDVSSEPQRDILTSTRELRVLIGDRLDDKARRSAAEHLAKLKQRHPEVFAVGEML